MISKAPVSGFGSPGQPYDLEARLLVQLLRTSRLSLLYAEAGADKTALLKLGLMPLLSRRTSDKLVPAGLRSSGVVVPFPDRRGRMALRALKRKREIVVNFDDWGEAPLAALRESLHQETGTGPAQQLAPSMRLSEVLADLSQRFDAHLVVLLDRFEDFLQARSPGAGHAQFSNELVEAINAADLPASFLIAVNEDAGPRLASLRARIPGFDDFSLKLTPPRDFKASAAPRVVTAADPLGAAVPEPIAAPPVLTEALAIPPVPARPNPTPSSLPVGRTSLRRKDKAPLPQVQVKTEDVYAMIEEALSRILASAGVDICLPNEREGKSLPESPSAPRHETTGKDLQKAIERMEHRLGAEPESGRHS